MSRNINIIILLVFLFGLTSCKLLNGSEEDPSSDVLMPLKVGSWWEYQVHKPQWNHPIVDTLRYEVVEKVTVTSDGIGYTAFAYNLVPFLEGAPEYYWLQRNGKDGLYQMGGIAVTDTHSLDNLEYKYPAEEGDTWFTPQLAFSRSEMEFYISDTLSITLIDTGRKVNTPAGTFTCYVYNFDLSAGDDIAERLDYYMFYSPGVGLIKQEERGQSDQRLITELVLVEYQAHKLN